MNDTGMKINSVEDFNLLFCPAISQEISHRVPRVHYLGIPSEREFASVSSCMHFVSFIGGQEAKTAQSPKNEIRLKRVQVCSEHSR